MSDTEDIDILGAAIEFFGDTHECHGCVPFINGCKRFFELTNREDGSFVYNSPLGRTVKLALTTADNVDLYGHYVWNAAILLANHFEAGTLRDVIPPSPTVCELGAASDYPLQSLLDVLKDNIEKNAPEDVPISIVGHEWGKDVKPVLDANDGDKFDFLILSDLFYRDEFHIPLLESCSKLVKPKDGVVLVCFGVHGPYVNPFDFFEQAKKFGFESTKLFEEDVANTNGGDANEPQILYVYTMKLN